MLLVHVGAFVCVCAGSGGFPSGRRYSHLGVHGRNAPCNARRNVELGTGCQGSHHSGWAPALGRLGYRPELDGLRAFAVVLVMLTHAWVSGFDQGGAVGVGVFFVLSGFLITSQLLREKDDAGAVDLRAFWSRRAVRLLPLLLLVLTIFSVFRLTEYQPDTWGILGILFYVGNWMSAFGLGILRPLDPAWTLGIEEQFYICGHSRCSSCCAGGVCRWPLPWLVWLSLGLRGG